MGRWITIFGLLAGILLTFLPVDALAASTPATGSPGQGLEISPPVIELLADPGQTVKATIRVRNITKGELIAKGRADDFGAGNDESGQPKFLLDEPGDSRYSLKRWVSGVPDLRLAPSELKTTTVTIAVPKNAEPGGHFGVVRFTAVPPDVEGTGVALSASVGALILLKVSGEIRNELSVAEFSAGQRLPAKEGMPGLIDQRSFFEYGPVEFVVRLKNGGSVHEKPQGSIVVTNTFGKQIGSLKVNPRGGNILPDSIRRFEQELAAKKLFGHYTAKLSISYAGGKKLSSNVGFWVIPWKLILLGLVGLVVIVFFLRKAIRKYNDHIIARARR
jgi:hypothetical protein